MPFSFICAMFSKEIIFKTKTEQKLYKQNHLKQCYACQKSSLFKKSIAHGKLQDHIKIAIVR